MRLHTLGLIVTLALGILTASLAADAQRAASVPRIGFLTLGAEPNANSEAFQHALHKRGWVEGQTIAIEYMFHKKARSTASRVG